MKKNILLYAFLMLPFGLLAQQKAQYSQYIINSYLINPALTGMEEYGDVKIGYRNQWSGVNGAPVTYYITGHTRLNNGIKSRKSSASEALKPNAFAAEGVNNGVQRKIKAHHGVGGIMLRDQIGPFSRTEASASYAYHLPLASNMWLATGTSLGVISQTFRSDAVTFANPNDNAAVSWNKMSPNLSTGFWLYADNFYAGASANQLFGNLGASADDRPGNNPLRSHYFLTGAYKYAPTPSLAFIPSVLIKYVQPVPVSVDYNLRAVYDDKYWAGFSYRQRDSFIILAGLTLNQKFDVSYAYDLGVSSLSSTSAGSHELVLGLRVQNRFK
jgi:type IX secretion system PorP/SprF family membrane protein